ncbi:MAG: DUF6644 family protein [Pseudomonadota bacterium]
MDLYPFFDWLDTSLLADISKAYGGVFAVVQMFHLLALALLGGTVLTADLRLLGVVMADVPNDVVQRNTQRWFGVALIVITISGIFMSSAVAMKLYYNESFWAKMIALLVGTLFFYFVRKPLLKTDLQDLNPWTVRAIAISSIVTWFTVAACGRWIGFS